MYDNSLYKEIENKKVKEFIRNIPRHIKGNCNFKCIEKDKIVVLKEHETEKIYIHCKGKMIVRNEFENGFIYDFASIEPISYIGAMEIMANKNIYSSTLQTMTNSIILEMDKFDFIEWINNDHKLTLDVLHFVSNQMYEQSLKTGEVLAYPAIGILINYLINVFERSNKNEVVLKKTREEIGSILGFSERTVNRNLKILKDENLVFADRRGILITEEQCEKLYKKLDSIKNK